MSSRERIFGLSGAAVELGLSERGVGDSGASLLVELEFPASNSFSSGLELELSVLELGLGLKVVLDSFSEEEESPDLVVGEEGEEGRDGEVSGTVVSDEASCL